MRLSWEGLLQNSECADLLRVKYWKVSDPNNYKTSDKFEVDTTSWEVNGLRKFQNYAFQVCGPISNISQTKMISSFCT